MEELQKNIQLKSQQEESTEQQPTPKLAVINGSSEAVVVIGNSCYSYQDNEAALEVVFYLFKTLNIPYPKICENAWKIIAHVLFNSEEKIESSVAELATQIKSKIFNE